MTRAQEPAELRPGLPPVELRRVHARWVDKDDDIIQFSTYGDFFTWVRSGGVDYTHEKWHRVDAIRPCFVTSFSPLGSTWGAVEALAAKAAEVR